MTKLYEMKPRPGEKVRDYVERVMYETGHFITTPYLLRKAGVYYDIASKESINLDMEQWVFEHCVEGSYYCTTTNVGFPTSRFNANVWFFDDKDTAALFKLAYGL